MNLKAISTIIIGCTLLAVVAKAQLNNGSAMTLQSSQQKDTTGKKTNTNDWKDFQTRIYYRKIYSRKILFTDTTLHTFHRRMFSQPWFRDLGNIGSPVINWFFEPEERTGLTLGYHSFDVYRFNPDSLNFYNTTRPYSVFSYQLGSKTEQIADFLHTQNVNPSWNFAAEYRKVSSAGYYHIQRNYHDLCNLTTNYFSINQQYRLQAALVYNKLQHDENGGIVADSFLSDPSFADRGTIPVWFQNDSYNQKRSAVTNVFRDVSLLLVHAYTWGRRDTLYSEDSSQITPKLTPRFSVQHRMQMGDERLQYKDLSPDSLRYAALFQTHFNSGDSVMMVQRQFYFDNGFSLNGFAGSLQHQLQFSAGFGVRLDKFKTDYVTGSNTKDYISNYLTGEIRKEALQKNEWSYAANGKFFLTGEAAGNFKLQANIGKELPHEIGNINIVVQQAINNAPYNFLIYRNAYADLSQSFSNKESVTKIAATVYNEKLHAGLGIRNNILANYFYLNALQQFDQYVPTINLTQFWGRKVFYFGKWRLDNELIFQQKTNDAPINIPSLAGRHMLSLEKDVFGNAMKMATGIDIRWHSAYAPAAYSPFFNRFYYQDNYTISNAPETSLFFNFMVKSFRAYFMVDQVQHLFTPTVISSQGYPIQSTMLRFGFSWVMIN